MKRRSFLAATLAIGAGMAGCSNQSAPEASTPTASEPLVESGSGDFPHEIRIENGLDREATITLAVERNGTQVYRQIHTVGAGADVVVAGITSETLPEESGLLTITATDSAGQSTSVEVSVSDCLGNVVVYYSDEGSLDSTYSIC